MGSRPSREASTGAEGWFEIDPVLKQIGHLNRFQWTQLFLAFLITCASGSGIVTYVFTGYQPNYRCAVPECEDPVSALYHGPQDTAAGGFPEYFEESVQAVPGYGKHSCQRYTFNTTEQQGCDAFIQRLADSSNSTSADERLVVPCEDLVFDKSIVKSSFATRFNLLCGRAGLNGLINSCVMLGMLLGSLPIGLMADKIGRKKALAVCIVVLSAAGTANAFVRSLALFALLRVLVGATAIGIFYCATVLIAEWLLPKDINGVMKLHGASFFVGNLFFVLVAYFVRNERDLQLAIFVPILAALLPLYFLKESARWLIAKDRTAEAKDILRHAAKINGRVLDENLLGPNVSKEGTFAAEEVPVVGGSFCDLFNTCKMGLRTLNSMFQWMCVTATFYGMVFGAVDLFGDKYSNFALGSFVGIPAILVTAYTFDRVGRKWSLVINQALAGISCIVIGCILGNPNAPKGLHLFLYLLGKVTSTVSFVCVIQYSAEMYPTSMRATATGLFSSSGRVGGIYALVILGLKKHWIGLPFVLFGVPSLIASILALAFPETTGSKLPETIQESLAIGSNPKYKPWCASNRVEDDS